MQDITMDETMPDIERQAEQPAEKEKKSSKNARNVERIKRIKKNLAMNPNSVAIAPHTEEGHILAYMTLWADKLIWTLRKKTGVIIESKKLLEYTKVFQKLIEKLYVIAGNPNMEYTQEFISEDKIRIANMKHSWIILPRTTEAKMLVYCVKIIDSLIMQTKATERAEVLFAKMQGFIRTIIEFDEILKTLSNELMQVSPKHEKKYIEYKTLPFVKKILNSEFQKSL